MIVLPNTLEYWFKENPHFSDESKDMQRKDHKLVGNLGFSSGFHINQLEELQSCPWNLRYQHLKGHFRG